MKTKPKPRARKMWANYHAEGYVCLYSIKGRCMNSSAEHIAIPVAVIPLDDQGALIAKATAAFLAEDRKPESWIPDDCMVAALSAIGVLPRQRKGGAK